MFENFIRELQKKMVYPLPGEAAQYLMAPQGRRNFPRAKDSSTAAVLLLLYPVNNQPWIVFIKRPEYEGAHSGQVSFPGGKVEASDKSLYDTALRETSEELGITTSDLNFIGPLSPLHIPVSAFDVHPFIASCNQKPKWNPDPNEVTYILETSIENLLKPETAKKEIWTIRNEKVEVPFFHVENEKIWGATAMIISEFLTILTS